MQATEASKALQVVLNLANVSNMDFGKAAENLVAVGTAFGYTAKGFERVSDVMSGVAAASMADISDMTEAFRTSSVVAQTYGASLEDVAVGLGLLAQIGIKGSAAGTALRQGYVELAGVSKQAKKAMQDVFKLNIFDDAAGKVKPMIEIIGSMAKTLKGYSTSEQVDLLNLVGNERGLKSISAWLKAYIQDAEKAEEATGGLVTVTGNALQ
jgi:TP901 family phage tail tape measure protein